MYVCCSDVGLLGRGNWLLFVPGMGALFSQFPFFAVLVEFFCAHLSHTHSHTQVKKEHQTLLNQFIENTRSMYSDAAAAARKWGGGVMGNKAQVKVAKRDKAIARERASIKA
jgi:hypothetical protein